MVWHHYRRTVRAYWKQQIGYGKAEAMLERKSPEKYNSGGHATWAGRIYVNGIVRTLSLSRGRIYQGTWGTAGYARLDDPRSAVRIRLKSSVVRVEHDGPPDRARGVRVAYGRDGQIHVARGRRAILACYNAIIPALVPELPARQKEALAYSVKVPMLYTNVLLRRWTAFLPKSSGRTSFWPSR